MIYPDKSMWNLFFFCCVFWGAGILFAQTDVSSEAAETIVLPDITTVISGDSEKINNAAVPDFSDALPENLSETTSLPHFAVAESDEDNDFSVSSGTLESDMRSVYMEGVLSGGWPLQFSGDFSVYSIGSHPFEVRFSHHTVDAYGAYSADEGFFNQMTELSADKTITVGPMVWKLNGSYKSGSVGVQGQSPVFDDINRRFLGGSAGFMIPIGQNGNFQLDMDIAWFSRYMGIVAGLQSVQMPAAISFFDASPQASFSWTTGDLSVGFSAGWKTGAAVNSGIDPFQRGNFGATLIWGISDFTVDAGAAVVWIPSGAGARNIRLLVPFSAGIEWNLPVAFSALPLSVEIRGGMDSFPIVPADFEDRNPFTAVSPESYISSGEQSDWFASVSCSIPVRNLFSLDASAEYRQTAFGNGILYSRYDELSAGAAGLFPSGVTDRKSLLTETVLTAGLGNFLLTAGWTGHWLDRLPGIAAQSLYASAGYTASSGIWGIKAEILEQISGADMMPVLDFSAEYRVSDRVKLTASVQDIVKLITASHRIFADPYIMDSGSVTASLQFYY